jgi:hypothetical protein
MQMQAADVAIVSVRPVGHWLRGSEVVLARGPPRGGVPPNKDQALSRCSGVGLGPRHLWNSESVMPYIARLSPGITSGIEISGDRRSAATRGSRFPETAR